MMNNSLHGHQHFQKKNMQDMKFTTEKPKRMKKCQSTSCRQCLPVQKPTEEQQCNRHESCTAHCESEIYRH